MYRRNTGYAPRLPVCPAAVCLVTGCYVRSAGDTESVYRFAWWVGLAAAAGGVLGVPLGLFLRRWSAKWANIPIFLAPVLLLIVAPTMYRDRVTVTDEHFEASYGFWFRPSVYHVRFDELSEIRVVAVQDSRGSTNYRLHCIGRNGGLTDVSVGDLVEHAVPEILQKATAKGIRIVETSR